MVLAAGKSKNVSGPISLQYTKTGQTLIEYQHNILKHIFPNANLFFIVGDSHRDIYRQYRKKIRLLVNKAYQETGPLGSVELGLSSILETRLLIISGDMFFNLSALQKVDLGESCVLFEQTKQLSEKKAGIFVENNKVINFSYGLPKKWAQISNLVSSELDMLYEEILKENSEKQHIFEAFNTIIDKDGHFSALELDPYSITDADVRKIGNVNI